MKKNYTPIILFAYKRLEHTQRTIESLLRNPISSSTDLFVYLDGPRSEEDISQVNAVKGFVKNIKGFKSLNIKERQSNFGLSKNILGGVSEVLGVHKDAIIVEDDLVTSQYFLEYMNTSILEYLNT